MERALMKQRAGIVQKQVAAGREFKVRKFVAFEEKFQGAHKSKTREVRSPTCEVLGAAAKNVGAQTFSWVPQATWHLLDSSLAEL